MIVGGGGFRVPLIHGALQRSRLDIDELVLHDLSPQRLDVIGRVLHDSTIPIRLAGDLDDALRGADLILSVVRIGGLEGRISDERSALDLGLIGQETVGAGGLLYAARSVPYADYLASRVRELAPQAWVVSMTNPAGVITEAMTPVLGPRVIGVCDSPAGLIARAARALELEIASLELDYLGLNHLGWLRSLSLDGVDRLPELLADDQLLRRIEEGQLFGPDLIRALGSLPNEYLYWYYAPREAVHALIAAGRTRGEHVRAEQEAFYARAADSTGPEAADLWRAANDERNRSYFAELREGERDDLDVSSGGYEGIAAATAEALFGVAPARLVLNVPNAGTVAAFDDDAVIETVCDVDTDGARARPVRAPDEHELGLMSTIKGCERAIIAAARAGSPDQALRAFATHPLVDSIEAARRLARIALP